MGWKSGWAERKLLNELDEQPDNVRRPNADNGASVKQSPEEKVKRRHLWLPTLLNQAVKLTPNSITDFSSSSLPRDLRSNGTAAGYQQRPATGRRAVSNQIFRREWIWNAPISWSRTGCRKNLRPCGCRSYKRRHPQKSCLSWSTNTPQRERLDRMLAFHSFY